MILIWRPALLLLGGLLLAWGSALGNSATVQSIALTSGDEIIASDADNPSALYQRDTIRFSVTTQFTRGALFPQVSTFRYWVRLTDGAGGHLLLQTEAGGTAELVARPFSVDFGTQTTVTLTHGFSIAPGQQILPAGVYAIEVLPQYQNLSGGGFTNAGSNFFSAYRRYWHFNATNPLAARRNVVAWVRGVTFAKTHALATANSVGERAVRARLEVEVRRYARWDTDEPKVTDTVAFRAGARLNPNGFNAVEDALPMHVDAPGQQDYSVALQRFQIGAFSVKVPFQEVLYFDVDLIPEGHLASVDTQYRLFGDIAHIELVGTGIYIPNHVNRAGDAGRVLHFNGDLRSVAGLADLVMTGIKVSGPGSFVSGQSFRTVDITVLSGQLKLNPNFAVTQPAGGATTNYTFTVRLFDTGVATVVSGQLDITIPPDQEEIVAGGNLRVRRAAMNFSAAGIRSDVAVLMPLGLGVATDIGQQSFYQEDRLEQAQMLLVPGLLRPAGPVEFLPVGADAHFVLTDERLPISIRSTSLSWNIGLGTLTPGPTPADRPRIDYVRHAQRLFLSLSPLTNEHKVLRSNAGYYALIANSPVVDFVFTADSNSRSLVSGSVSIAAGGFRSHFPYDGLLGWGVSQNMAFADTAAVAGTAFSSPRLLSLPYSRNCTEAAAGGCGGLDDVRLTMTASEPLKHTHDGGWRANGNLNIGSRQLQIGYIDAMTVDPAAPVFAHRLDNFQLASFMVPGHVLRSGSLTVAPELGPAVLLLSGVSEADPLEMDRPRTRSYATGAGDYAGLNVRRFRQTAMDGQSVLGGVATPNYDLGTRSKYYVRQSGVSGIHEPAANPFPDPVEIYGYLFEFDRFGLSFLSSRVHDSITAGSLYMPDPSAPSQGFTVAFDPLYFNCLGGLSTAGLDGGPFAHRLAYWAADIIGLNIAFTPKAGAACNPGEAFFSLGVEAYASNVDARLYGTLLFYPDGDLVPPADPQIPPGMNSRLGVPTAITLGGPTGENYRFSPMHAAYLNRFAAAPLTRRLPGQGFISLSGLLDVAFFRDLEVHMQTGARKDNSTDPIFVMGGWATGGQGLATSSSFDLEHRGFPPTATLDAYRAGSNSIWQVTAHQSWLDLLDFTYPLRWDSATRVFSGRDPVRNDFIVLSTEHRLKFLTPATAEIDFGAGVDLIIPEVSIAGIATGTPMLPAFSSVSATLTDVLLDGLAGGERLLNDWLEHLFEDILAATIDPVIDDLAAAIAALDPLTNPAAELATLLDDQFAELQQRFTAASGVAGELLVATDLELARLQIAIRTLIGNVELDGNGEPRLDNLILINPEDVSNAVSTVLPGFFPNTHVLGEIRYAIAEQLLLAVLQEVDAALLANLILNAGAAAFEDAIAAALAQQAPAIEQIKRNLMVVHNAIGSVRTVGHMAAELEHLFTRNTTAVATFLAAARSTVELRIDPTELAEWTAAALKEDIRSAVRDQFNASPLTGALHTILRGYVYDLDASMRSAIDSLFAQLNSVLFDLVRNFVPITIPPQNFLGDLAGTGVVGRVDGYARIVGDSLRTLRLDADFECRLPDPFTFAGFLEIHQLNSSGSGTCAFTPGGDLATEVRIGANEVPVGWLGRSVRFNISTQLTLDPQRDNRLVGLAGAFEMSSGVVQFEAFEIDQMGAAAAFGLTENYLAAKVSILFNGDRIFGGVFFGRTCSLTPLEMIDPLVAAVLPAPSPTLTGIYAYGEAFIPIINFGCLFSLSANAGAGIFAFEEGTIFGGKMLVGGQARAICAVNVGGEITLVGVKTGNDFRFAGAGRMYGSAGVKPLKVSFDKRVTLTYQNNKWDYDF